MSLQWTRIYDPLIKSVVIQSFQWVIDVKKDLGDAPGLLKK